MRHLFTAALVLSLVLAGCGGGNDEEKARGTVREFFTALKKKDVDKLCNRLLTKDFIEQSTGASGDQAGPECRRQYKGLGAPTIKLNSVGKAKIDGDNATVAGVVESQGQERPQVFRLKKEGGDWRLAGGAG